MNTPTKYDDVINSRDVIARIEELQDEREALADAVEEARDELDKLDPSRTEDLDDVEDLKSQLKEAEVALAEWDADNAEELKGLLDLQEEAEYSPDWKYGETLIRDSYFETYAQELAEDCGMLENTNNWPLTCIDWERAARELKVDYMSVDFLGTEYLIRA